MKFRISNEFNVCIQNNIKQITKSYFSWKTFYGIVSNKLSYITIIIEILFITVIVFSSSKSRV